jgi:RNA recognition motif-containing protein
MAGQAEEDAAIQALDGAEWMGREMKLNKARPRDNDNGNSRSAGGGGQYRRSSF